MLSIKLQAISKFKDIENNEIIYKRHKRKDKKRIHDINLLESDSPQRELHRSLSLDIPLKPEIGMIPITFREEKKGGDLMISPHHEADDRNLESLYASTDIRTSIDPTMSLQRRTNNFVTDEHISITNRPGGTIEQTTTLSHRLPPINTRNRYAEIIKDPELFRINGPNNDQSQEEMPAEMITGFTQTRIVKKLTDPERRYHQNAINKHLKNHQIMLKADRLMFSQSLKR